MTVVIAVPFIVFALYVNPLLRMSRHLYRTSKRIAQKKLRKTWKILKALMLLLYSMLTNILFLGFIFRVFVLFTAFVFVKWTAIVLKLARWLKVTAHWFRKYKKAKKVGQAHGVQYHKRHALARELVAWVRKKRREEDEARLSNSSSISGGWVESRTVSTHRSIGPSEGDPGPAAPWVDSESAVQNRNVTMESVSDVTEEASGTRMVDNHCRLAID